MVNIKDMTVKELIENTNYSDKHNEAMWAKRIFTDNIDIIGFSLDVCEIDIRWLLTYRASLFYTNKDNARKLIYNTITLHHIDECVDIKMKNYLENLNVVYKFHKIIDKLNKNCYFETYLQIAEEIRLGL